MKVIHENLHGAIIQYLAKCPWHEVNDLIQGLAGAKDLQHQIDAMGKVLMPKAQPPIATAEPTTEQDAKRENGAQDAVA